MKKEILEYKELLRKYFSKETAHPSCQNNYEKNDCSYGQCAITSMLVFKKFGGTINKINLDEESSHYFNIINNEIIDLTKEQYKNQLDYSNYIEKDFNTLFQNEDTKKRYFLLKEKVNLALIDQKIASCTLCKDLVEHFPNSKTISYGKTKKNLNLRRSSSQ